MKSRTTRRSVLKAAGFAAGSGVITGFPFVHSAVRSTLASAGSVKI